MSEKTNTIAALPIERASISEMAYFFLILLIWSKDVLLTYIRAVIMRIPFIGRYPDVILSAVWIVCIFFAAFKIIRMIKGKHLLFVALIVAVYFLNYLLFPENSEVLSDLASTFLLSVLPMYFIGAVIDLEKFYKYFYVISLLSVLFMAYYKIFVHEAMDDVTSLYTGDMYSAYNILPHTCLVFYGVIKSPSFLNTITSVIGFVLMFSLGCRGAFGILIAFMLIMIIWFKKYKYPIFAYSLLVSIGTLIVTFMQNIMIFMGNIALKLGLSVRIFAKTIEGQLFESKSRENLLDIVREEIFTSPLLGQGLAADRRVLHELYDNIYYSHNIAYDFWLSFGVIFGTILLALIVFQIIRAYISCPNNEHRIFLIIFIFAGFVHLFLSGSYLTSAKLFLLLGLCVNYIDSRKIRKSMFLK